MVLETFFDINLDEPQEPASGDCKDCGAPAAIKKAQQCRHCYDAARYSYKPVEADKRFKATPIPDIAPVPELPPSTFPWCPRCSDRLVVEYEEPSCVTCGYVDYSYTPPRKSNGHISIFTSSSAVVLRYGGNFPDMQGKLITVWEVPRVHQAHDTVYTTYLNVTCPWCGKQMSESSLSGKRRDPSERRFKCSQGHRISIFNTSRNRMAWK